MEEYFKKFRDKIIGIDTTFINPYDEEIKVLYADWIASGRLYSPIERILSNNIYPYVGNTHTETNITGKGMTIAYNKAKSIIKNHVNASNDDVLISTGSGMTGVMNKLIRILGLRIHEKHIDKINIPEDEKPIVFITHMEHHSNQVSWLETICDVEIVPANEDGLVSLEKFEETINKYKNRKHKIASVTACSNVTGICTPYHEIAEIIHKENGFIFVDFACSAPYMPINMHPEIPEQYLDAITFSPHKFLGGPGTSGILVFNKKLYDNKIPDEPGGGTVDWTNPWGEHRYHENIEEREDGGTPSFLQTIKAALCIKLKEKMGCDNIKEREEQLLDIIWQPLNSIDNLNVLANNIRNRLGIISFYIDDLHYNLGVKILNDRFGIQVRGGCSCAGTYGHYLLGVDKEQSKSITGKIDSGDLSEKPGWIRLSIHPTMTNEEVKYIVESIKDVAENHKDYSKDYINKAESNEIFFNKLESDIFIDEQINKWFECNDF